MSKRSQAIQTLLGVTRVAKYEPQIPGIMFARELYPANHGTPVNQLGFFLSALYSNALPIEYKLCDVCGVKHAKHILTFVESDSLWVCPTCYKERLVCCDQCGETTVVLRMANMRAGNRGLLCRNCLDRHYYNCGVCGVIEYVATNRQNINGTGMCSTCAEKYRAMNHYCQSCGKWVPIGHTVVWQTTGGRVCVDCYIKASRPKRPMKECKGYGSTGGSVFFTTDPAKLLFLGAEVEVTNGHYPQDYDRSNPEFAEGLMEFQEGDRKSDASVSKGHEWATQAMTLGYHQNYFKWQKLMELHIAHGFDGHDSPYAGFHIHASRAFFGERKTAAQDLKIGKLLFLLDRNDWRTQWKKFSRRNNKAVRDANIHDPWGYCDFYDIDWSAYSIVDGLNKAMVRNQQERNMWLNFYNHHSSPVKIAKTVEWRGLKSHTNYRVILAGLEMMDLLCRIAESKITEASTRAMTWKQMCKKIPNTSPDLVWYLQSKRLWER